MTTAIDPTRDRTSGSPAETIFRSHHLIAGVRLDLETDDVEMLREFERLFACDSTGEEPLCSFRAVIHAGSEEYGVLRVSGDDLMDGANFLAGFASPAIPLVVAEAVGGRPALALEGESQALFIFDGGDCQFRKAHRWRRILSHFLYLRLLRLRQDLLFFHAASLSIDGTGVLLVGPKGSGKTTLSSAIAALGHPFLGDETAAYCGQDQTILPMRRPLSVKPGVRAQEVERLLAPLAARGDEDGIMHIRAVDLFEQPAAPTKLGAVVFLDGFAGAATIEKVPAGRDELAALQPIRSSSFGEAPSRHVFAMIRLLGSLDCYRLRAGKPEETARLLIEVIRNHGTDSQAAS